MELLYGIPFGQQESLNNSTKSIMSIRPKENVKSELRRLKLEQQHIQRRVRPVLRTHFILKSLSERVGSDIERLWILNDYSFLCWLKIDWIWRHWISESFYVGSDLFRQWFQKWNGLRLDYPKMLFFELWGHNFLLKINSLLSLLICTYVEKVQKLIFKLDSVSTPIETVFGIAHWAEEKWKRN